MKVGTTKMVKRLLVLVVAFAAAAFVAGCGGGGGGSQESANKTLTLGNIGWTENVAVANLTKVVLEKDLGYQEVELKTLDVGLLFRSEEHTSELQSRQYLVCRLLLEKKKLTSDIST